MEKEERFAILEKKLWLQLAFREWQNINPLIANPTNWSNTLNSLAYYQQMFWVCLIVLWDWRSKG